MVVDVMVDVFFLLDLLLRFRLGIEEQESRTARKSAASHGRGWQPRGQFEKGRAG